MIWYVMACLWCVSLGFVIGLCVGWFSTATAVIEKQEPSLRGLQPVKVPHFCRN